MIMTQTHKPLLNSTDQPENGINPKKFLLWLIIVASLMLFAAFTSAYIVRRGEGNWLIFDLPEAFRINVGIILLSSVSMQLAYRAAKRDELGKLKIYLFTTLFLGLAFMVGQWIGYKQLVSQQIFLVGNPSESFVYVISATHLFHILLGLGFIIAVIFKSFQFKVHKKNMLSINMCTTFWHFLGILWVYLYFFFLINR